MDRTSCFGIGCFHFGILVTTPSRFVMKQYVRQVEQFLDFTETVEEHSTDAKEADFELTTQPYSMDSGGFFPGEFLHRIEFVVRIAHRVQDEILRTIRGDDFEWAGPGTEIFKVTMEYYYHGPIAVVECLDVEDGSSDPADAVVVVREYIKDKVREYGSGLRFETKGPSPFHAHFFIEEDESTKSFTVDHNRSYGYDRISFRVCPEIYRNRTTWILDLMGHHLSYFYELSRVRSSRMDAWRAIETTWNAVKAVPEASIVSRIREWLARRSNTERLIRDTMDFRAKEVFERQQADSQRQSLSRSENCPDFLTQSVDEYFDETFSKYPTAEVLTLAAFYENKNAKRRDRFAFFVAAVAGGVVGSIITLLAG